jgi:hypothetical protein
MNVLTARGIVVYGAGAILIGAQIPPPEMEGEKSGEMLEIAIETGVNFCVPPSGISGGLAIGAGVTVQGAETCLPLS